MRVAIVIWICIQIVLIFITLTLFFLGALGVVPIISFFIPMILLGLSSIGIFLLGGRKFLMESTLEIWNLQKRIFHLDQSYTRLKQEQTVLPATPCFIEQTVSGLGWSKTWKATDIVITNKRILLMSTSIFNMFASNSMKWSSISKKLDESDNVLIRSNASKFEYKKDEVGEYIDIEGERLAITTDKIKLKIYHPEAKKIVELFGS